MMGKSLGQPGRPQRHVGDVCRTPGEPGRVSVAGSSERASRRGGKPVARAAEPRGHDAGARCQRTPSDTASPDRTSCNPRATDPCPTSSSLPRPEIGFACSTLWYPCDSTIAITLGKPLAASDAHLRDRLFPVLAEISRRRADHLPRSACYASPESSGRVAWHRTASVRHYATGRDLFLGRVLCSGLLDHGRNNGIVARDPIRRDIPFFAVPGLDAACPRAFVICARDLDRLQLVLEAELLEPLRSQVEIFESPSDLLAGQRLLAKFLLRCADCFDTKHGID